MTSSTAAVAAPSALVSERQRLIAAIIVGVIGPEVFIVQPGFVQGLVQTLGFNDQGAGYVASIEVWGITATTVLMTFFSHLFDWRRAITVSLIVVAVANALCLGVHDHQVFMALRFLAGLGSGTLVSLSFTTVGMTSHPDRNFGYLIMWVLLYGALVLPVMPYAYEFAGMNGVLAFFAAFPLIALPLVKAFPRNGEAVASVERDAVDLRPALKGVALVAMLAYFTAQGVAWAYLFLIGTAGGVSEQHVATGLSLSQFAGVAGAMVPALVGNRFGRWGPLSIGILGGAFCLVFLVGQFSYLTYAVWVCLYNLFWNQTHPFLLGSMASFDRHGRVVTRAVAMQMIGLAIGPALAAYSISPGHYGNVNRLAIALFVVSWVCILPPVLVQRREARVTS